MSQPDNDQSVAEQLEDIMMDLWNDHQMAEMAIRSSYDEAKQQLKALLLDAENEALKKAWYSPMPTDDYIFERLGDIFDLTNQKNRLKGSEE